MYCTYLTVYLGNKLPPFYIGYSTIDKVLNKNYHGTPTSKKYSQIFYREQKENPHLFKTKIISKHSSKINAQKKETKILTHFDAKNNPMYINMSNSDTKWYSRSGYKISEKHKQAIRNYLLTNGNRGMFRGGKQHPYYGKHSPAYGMKHSPKTIEKVVNKVSKKWLVTFPNGEKQQIKNLAKFCRENNIHYSNLRERGKSKNFKAVLVDE